MKNNLLVIFAIPLMLVLLSLPTPHVEAQTGLLPFAGIVSFTEECTCSGNTWIWFAPLYLGGEEVITGPMVYSPYATTLYAYYNIGVSGLWHLGDYTSITDACWVVEGDECVEYPSVGLMSKVGTNYESIQAP